ncbi:MAG: energy transducer TonB [Bacteroidia bacterium]
MDNIVQVPDPCGENWSGMQKQGNGRYCDSCKKVVVDFRNKSNEEILDYIRENSGKKICGTFKNTQLIPPDPFVRNQKVIRFLAAALLVFGMTLFSCQSVDLGDKPPVPEQNFETTGLVIAPVTEDSTANNLKPVTGECIMPPPSFSAPVPVDEPTTTGDISMPGRKTDTLKAKSGEEIILFADVMPQFPGELQEFIQNNLVYPQSARDLDLQGMVIITFTVMKDGTIAEPKILKGLSKDCDKEALRVIKMMPKWKPGFKGERAMNVQMNIPIKFRLQ